MSSEQEAVAAAPWQDYEYKALLIDNIVPSWWDSSKFKITFDFVDKLFKLCEEFKPAPRIKKQDKNLQPAPPPQPNYHVKNVFVQNFVSCSVPQTFN